MKPMCCIYAYKQPFGTQFITIFIFELYSWNIILGSFRNVIALSYLRRAYNLRQRKNYHFNRFFQLNCCNGVMTKKI